MTDPIADMLTRIRNGYMAHKKEVEVPYSKMKHSVGDLLKEAGYLSMVDIDASNKRILKMGLVYVSDRPAINSLVRVSKPGRRVYMKSGVIPRPLSGYGVAIVSTSRGLMSGTEAKKKKLGGEVVCEVW